MAHLCTICGEPMQPGEEMFKFHGSLGPCPKPPLAKMKPVAEIAARDDRDGTFWLDVKVDRAPYHSAGPFLSAAERDRAKDDLLSMLRSVGGSDVSGAVN